MEDIHHLNSLETDHNPTNPECLPDSAFDHRTNSKNFTDEKKNLRKLSDSLFLDKKLSTPTTVAQNHFKTLSPSQIFRLHEGNFYSYLNVEDHKQIIERISKYNVPHRRKIDFFNFLK